MLYVVLPNKLSCNLPFIKPVYFQIGQYIRERIIPKAIWYFTNEVTDIESDLDDGESDEDYSDTSDYVS